MNARFYVYKNDQTLGPYTQEEIEERLTRGTFAPEDLFWCEGMANRMVISKMKKKEASLPAPAPTRPPSIPAPSPQSPIHARSSATIDKLLIVGGAVFLFYFYMLFDSTVKTSDGDRVNNLGLMQDRTMGCVVSVGAIIVGAILQNSRRKKSMT